jgi:hypothetical protein
MCVPFNPCPNLPSLYKTPSTIAEISQVLVIKTPKPRPTVITISLLCPLFVLSLSLYSVVVTPATVLVDPLSSLHILPLFFQSDGITSLVPHGTAASVSESL